ncbi:hypothetical protein A1O3_08606 [Capronia epimyces CBS 606.96]|uniref:Telomere replication protein EST3 n=1 Tax=Capronia epimyces CBS 606.96 TaxID=1182542 RepID=W9XP51_9EURO|nr:uncharacterized protein A1O3_08606 [Capronia epimyces CBS 606.96]EXJ79105.1 hypothetical protein A1O3_08606 [Capronia epimyces CBS 606.96]
MQQPPSPSPRWPRSKVSDGKHQIQAIFLEGAAAIISRIYSQSTSDGGRIVAIRVKDPLINITVHCDPPKAELHINSVEIVNIGNDTTGTLPVGSTVLEDKVVRRTLAQYGLFKSDRGRDGITMASSPQSIKSQAGCSPIQDRNIALQDDIPPSQSQFWTQIHGAARRTEHDSATTVVTSDNTPLLKLLKAPTLKDAAAKPTLFTSQAQDEDENSLASLAGVEKPEELVPIAPEVSFKTATPIVSAPLPDPLINQAKDEGIELVSNHTISGTKSKSHQLQPPELSGTSTHPQQNISPAVSNEQFRHFQRWRQQARAGKYVPRYIQMIPKDQEKLLVSSDSWQPPLVGHPIIPGQVPTLLLERLTDAADNPEADNPEEAGVIPEPPPSSHGNEDQTNTDNDASNDGPSDSEAEENSSETDASPVSWSPSPTPEQRRMALPPDSPPVLLHQLNRNMKDLGPPSRQVDESGTLEKQSMARAGDSMDADCKPGGQVCDLNESSLETPLASMEQIGSDPLGQQIRPHTQPVQEAGDDEMDAGQLDELAALPTNPVLVSSAKVVQVEQTPYFRRGFSHERLESALTHSRSQDALLSNDHWISSSFIPGSVDETAPVGYLPSTKGFNLRGMAQGHMPELGRIDATGRDSEPDLRADRSQTIHAVGTLELVNCEDQSTTYLEEQTNSDGRTNGSKKLDVRDRPAEAPGTTSGHHGDSVLKSGDKDSLQRRGLSVDLDPQPLNEGLRRPSPSLTVSEPGSNLGSLTARKEKQSQVKRKPPGVEGVGRPNKRPRTETTAHDNNVPDEDYDAVFPKLREYRRETLPSLSKPKFSRVHAASSSPKDPGGDGDVSRVRAIPSPARGQNVTPGSAVASRTSSSTPLTRMSTYNEIEQTEVRTLRRESDSAISDLSSRGQEMLFFDFKSAYPDYEGTIKDFTGSCRVLSKMMTCGQVLHPSLYDDAIFHHYHSYRRYLSEEALNCAVPLPFYDFYNERVDEPSHSQRIVTRSALHYMLGSGGPSDGALNNMRERGVFHPSTSPEVARAESKTSKGRVSSTLRRTSGQDVRDVDTPHRPRDAVEEWRQDAWGTASPELGTPDIDRSLSDIPVLDISVDDNQSPASGSAPASASMGIGTGMGPPRGSKKRSLPWDPKVVESKGMPKSRSSLASTPHVSKRPRLSASPFVRPAKPAAATVKAQSQHREKSQSGVGAGTGAGGATKMGPNWWKDTDTPFKRFMDGYSRLKSNKQEFSWDAIGLEKPRVGGIDLFAWRR